MRATEELRKLNKTKEKECSWSPVKLRSVIEARQTCHDNWTDRPLDQSPTWSGLSHIQGSSYPLKKRGSSLLTGKLAVAAAVNYFFASEAGSKLQRRKVWTLELSTSDILPPWMHSSSTHPYSTAWMPSYWNTIKSQYDTSKFAENLTGWRCPKLRCFSSLFLKTLFCIERQEDKKTSEIDVLLSIFPTAIVVG